MFHIVLVEPEIPANTGNIGRTCVLTGARLHLVGPLGFALDERALQRAGLAYWESLDLRVHESWTAFLADEPEAARCLAGAGTTRRMHFLTKTGASCYADACYRDGDWLVFGKESAGLPQELLAARPDLCERIPMRGDDALANADAWHERFEGLHPELDRDACGNFVDRRAAVVTSLNLSNAVSIVLFEALRQTGFPGLR